MTPQDLSRHFGLSLPPFARAVPAAGLLRHKTFVEAHTRLQFAIEARSPAVLLAEHGSGKSTLLGVIADALDQARCRLVYTALSSCGPFGLIGQLAARYGVKSRRSSAQTAQALLEELGRSERAEILVLDEAHRLPDASLDELRLLSNTDFDRSPPFALILAGQSPLRARLLEADHASLWQRIAIRTSLAPLSDIETAEYLERRVRAAGAGTMLFRPTAVEKVFERSRGVLRDINNLATGALLAAATAKRKHVDLKDVQDAAFDLDHA